MICKNCNAEIDNSSVFCINCGTPVEIEKPKPQPVYQQPQQPAYQPPQPTYQQPQQPVYQQPQQPMYQQPVYQQPQQPVYQQPVYQQPAYEEDEYDEENNAPITRVGQYVGWFIISMIPIVGFPILTIVFACIRNHSNKNRANFFTAIWALLGIVLAIAAFVGLLILVFTAVLGYSLY